MCVYLIHTYTHSIKKHGHSGKETLKNQKDLSGFRSHCGIH